jgi:hypothetical protein
MNKNDKDSAQLQQTELPEGDEGNSIEWTSHPVKRRPLVSALATMFLTLVAAVVFFATDSLGFALLALVVLFASLARFYFPTSYRLSDRRITVKTVTQTLHKEWSLYRSCYVDKNGILLSTFTRPSRLENFRGLFLLFANNREEVTAFVRARLSGDGKTDNIANAELSSPRTESKRSTE